MEARCPAVPPRKVHVQENESRVRRLLPPRGVQIPRRITSSENRSLIGSRTRSGRLRLQLTGLLTDTPMRHDFNIDHLHRILANCPEYEADHHLNRPFMSAYQIAIRFAEEHPNHDLVRTLPLGGEGTGTNQSLTQRIARFLSQAIRDGTAGGIEGGFISHACVDDFCFRHRGRRVRVSTLRTAHAHSIFRVRRDASHRPS